MGQDHIQTRRLFPSRFLGAVAPGLRLTFSKSEGCQRLAHGLRVRKSFKRISRQGATNESGKSFR